TVPRDNNLATRLTKKRHMNSSPLSFLPACHSTERKGKLRSPCSKQREESPSWRLQPVSALLARGGANYHVSTLSRAARINHTRSQRDNGTMRDTDAACRWPSSLRLVGFTLIELLVVIAIIAILA